MFTLKSQTVARDKEKTWNSNISKKLKHSIGKLVTYIMKMFKKLYALIHGYFNPHR